MVSILVVFAFISAIGVAALLHYVAKAPEGYQDSSGFRFGSKLESDREGGAISAPSFIGVNLSTGRAAAMQRQQSYHSTCRGN